MLMYYNALRNGMEIRMDSNGNPTLQKLDSELETIWELRSKPLGSPGISLGWKDKLKDELTQVDSLRQGSYVFQAHAKFNASSLFANTSQRQVQVSVNVEGANGRTLFNDFKVTLDYNEPSLSIPFKVTHEIAPAKVSFKFVSKSLLKKISVNATLQVEALSDIMQAYLDALHISERIKHPGEKVVTLEKDADGVGLNFANQDSKVVIVSVTPGGVAGRTNKIKPGDQIVGVQGERVEDFTLKQIGTMLRNSKCCGRVNVSCCIFTSTYLDML